MHINFPSVIASILMLTGSAAAVGRAFSEFEISTGVAGAALEEAQSEFPKGTELTKAELNIVNKEAQCAVKAEQAFIDAMTAAGADSEDGKALGVGMIKNKVLKIQGTLQAVKGFIAGGDDTPERQAQIEELTTKLNVNTAIDKESAGALSKSVDFTC